MKTGRPSKYETHVKPRFAEIKEWLKAGATDKEIALNLDINAKVLCKYKNQFNELNELFKNGRISAVQDIKAALYKRATGFHYTERKKVTERMKLPKELKDFLDGVGIDTDKLENPVLVRTEEVQEPMHPLAGSHLVEEMPDFLLKEDDDGNGSYIYQFVEDAAHKLHLKYLADYYPEADKEQYAVEDVHGARLLHHLVAIEQAYCHKQDINQVLYSEI